MNAPMDQQPRRVAVAATCICAAVQLIYGLLLLALRFVDLHRHASIPSSEANLPFVIMGAPFLFIAWGLWRRRRWGLWLGLVHSALLPVTIRVVSSFLPQYGGGSGGPGWPGFGEMITILCVLPFYLLNVLGFALLLAIPRTRRSFKRHDGSWSQWSLRSLLAVTLLAPPLLTADYTIPRQQSARRKEEAARYKQARAQADKETRDLVKSVLAEDPQTLATAARQLPAEAHIRLQEMIQDSEPAVRRKIARVLVQGVHPTDDLAVLAEIVFDPEQPPEIRRDALRKTLALRSKVASASSFDYAGFFDTLAGIDHRDSLEVVLVVAESLRDKTQPHWSVGGAFDAPMETVDFLAKLGPQAEAAVPALTECLEHPGQWNFVPAVARALGEIGPAADSAVPALVKIVDQTQYGGKLTEAAKDALTSIRGAWGLIITGQVRDEQGEPVPDAEVKMVSDNNRFRETTVRTDTEGHFVFPQIPRGAQPRLEARHVERRLLGMADVPTDGQTELAWSHEVVLTANSTATVNALALVDGQPTAGVVASALLDNKLVATAKTDESGRFALAMVPSGNVRIALRYKSEEFTRLEREVRVEPGNTYALEPFHLWARNMTVSGTVVDQHGKPVRGVLVGALEAGQQRSSWFVADEPTGDDGAFVIDRLPNVPLILHAFPNPRKNPYSSSSPLFLFDTADPDRVSLAAEPGQKDIRIVISRTK